MPAAGNGGLGSGVAVRLDRWLVATRLFKTRVLAQTACRGGHVRINGVVGAPSSLVKTGDEISAESPRGTILWTVRQLAEKRLSAPQAQLLYEDHSPPPPPREEQFPRRDAGAGRPNKHERDALRRLRGDPFLD